eukprot:RCo030183
MHSLPRGTAAPAVMTQPEEEHGEEYEDDDDYEEDEEDNSLGSECTELFSCCGRCCPRSDSRVVSLASRFSVWVRVLIPVLVLFTLGVIVVGQNMLSFEIHVTASLMRTNLTDVVQLQLSQGPLSLPNISFSSASIDCKVERLSCQRFGLGSVWANPLPDLHLAVAVRELSAVCVGYWSYEEHIWPHLPQGSGKVLVTIGPSNLTAVLNFTRLGKEKVDLGLQRCSANFTIRDIDFADAGITGALLKLFRSKISDVLTSYLDTQTCVAVRQAIDSAFHHQLPPSPKQALPPP